MKKLHIAFLWHQHQPLYKNPSTDMYELPWVRLHATKDYYDMVRLLDDFPKIKANFNLVPSLLTQLEDYASGKATDKYLELTLKDAATLEEKEKIFILENFFKANWDNMVYPNNRYHQLLEKRGKQVSEEEIKRLLPYFTVTDIRDLQVWFNLSWMDPYWQKNEPVVRSLCEKERDFSEEDKKLIIKKQREICGLVIPKHKELQDRGQIEVSISPFYHPILPLLCDTNSALEAMPEIKLPQNRFRHPEDAAAQVRKSVEYYKDRFGRPPRGMWPSEGSVSEEIVPILADAGIKWLASDEEILFKSDPAIKERNNLFRPYNLKFNGKSLDIIFRERGLSDAIGFVYSKWNAKEAVEDFMHKIRNIKHSLKDGEKDIIVPVILDGENCWEFYPKDGNDFLKLLYKTISEDPEIETVTIGDFLEKHQTRETLTKLRAGSWINANFKIWIGHEEDNIAWQYITDARNFIIEFLNAHPDKKESSEAKTAWENLYAAEGSDWMWWYGDDNYSDNDLIFDFLFRQHLSSIYEIFSQKTPDALYKAIKNSVRQYVHSDPKGPIKPQIDGIITSHDEWQNAGFYDVGRCGGSMHQVETIVKSFHYGIDNETLFIRIDLNIPIDSKLMEELTFGIIFLGNANAEALLSLNSQGKINSFIFKNGSGTKNLNSAAGHYIIELSVPFKEFAVADNLKNIEFVVSVQKNGLDIERWPCQTSVKIPIS